MVMESKGGKLIPFKEARQFGRYALNIVLASKVLERMPIEDQFSKDLIKSEVSRTQKLQEQDLEDVCEIIGNRHAYCSSSKLLEDKEAEEEIEFLERDPNMPNLGTRVRRGPDWKWKNQDGQGAGTVVGHGTRAGWINVEWDTGLMLPYRYGCNGLFNAYDIEPCEEPRIRQNHTIAVGCLVQRGPDWKWGDQDGGDGNIGTVYRLKTPTEIYVRWPNGNKSNYRYGYKHCYDVKLCDPFDPCVKDTIRRQGEASSIKSAHISSPKVGIVLDTSGNSLHDLTSGQSSLYSCKRLSRTKKGKYYFKNSTGNSKNKTWQWRALDNNWHDFSKSDNQAIENGLAQGKVTTVLVTIHDQSYRVNLKKKIMVNTKSKAVSDIRLHVQDKRHDQ
uniref:Uncharacterized protein LOC111128392 n=1 Tax=Crassostrea virginica TaxID=6565 RepID=A0A8B8DPQ3_CRAVI|nr:uncharacterized protein LOC111128392 [Crassostrea virginica]